MSRAHRQRGFTLVEVVVAFVIFAITAAAVYEILFGALRRSIRSANETQAWLIAQSLRDEYASQAQPWPSVREGDISGVWRWRITTRLRDTGGAVEGIAAQDLVVQVWRRGASRPLAELRSTELSRPSS